MADNKLPPIKPFPTLPDPKEYMHLSEDQKMMQGFPHRPLDEYKLTIKPNLMTNKGEGLYWMSYFTHHAKERTFL